MFLQWSDEPTQIMAGSGDKLNELVVEFRRQSTSVGIRKL